VKLRNQIIVTEKKAANSVPYHDKKTKTFLLKSGEMKLSAEMAGSVFGPGDSLPLRLHVDNTTSKPLTSIKIRMARTEKVGSGDMVCTDEKELWKQQYPGCEGKATVDKV
jgi:hypothetical protein